MQSLALQPAASPQSASEIDPEWWLEFRRHAGGLAATFTPAILGFAAPLDNVSALLDGSRRPVALLLPIALAAAIWALLWGGILNRFARGTTTARAFLTAGTANFTRMLVVTAAAAAVNVLLYLTLHALLLGPVYGAIAARVSTERDAFFARVALYVIFGTVLVFVNAVFSFARINIVVDGEQGTLRALARGWQFVRARLRSVAALYLLFILVFGTAMIVYGAGEIIGGSRVGGWRAVVIGQAFIAFRLALRLGLAASQVRLAAPARD
jgi:hypothetical protein